MSNLGAVVARRDNDADVDRVWHFPRRGRMPRVMIAIWSGLLVTQGHVVATTWRPADDWPFGLHLLQQFGLLTLLALAGFAMFSAVANVPLSIRQGCLEINRSPFGGPKRIPLADIAEVRARYGTLTVVGINGDHVLSMSLSVPEVRDLRDWLIAHRGTWRVVTDQPTENGRGESPGRPKDSR